MPPPVFPEMVLAMTVIVPVLFSMPPPKPGLSEFFVTVLSMTVMVPPPSLEIPAA